MEKQFPGFYPQNLNNLKTLVDSSTVVFGATVLLDLYRINHWSYFLDIAEGKIKQDKRWLPYDTAWYYHTRLPQTIQDEIEKVKTASMYLQNFKDMIDDGRHHPFVQDDIMSKFNEFVQDATNALASNTNSLTDNYRVGEVKRRIAKFFEGRTGSAYDESKLSQLLTESETRFHDQMCPCISLSTSQDKRIKANRYIIWKQMQQHAKETQEPILLVLNRITPNWFAIYHDDVVVPQPSLVNEFIVKTGQPIYIVSAHDFIRQIADECDQKNELLKELHDKPTFGNNQQIDFHNNDQQINGNG